MTNKHKLKSQMAYFEKPTRNRFIIDPIKKNNIRTFDFNICKKYINTQSVCKSIRLDSSIAEIYKS